VTLGSCEWETNGSCGVYEHDHMPWYMKLYWRSPLGLVVPPVWYFGARMGWWN
jgi:hypothetical protein